jgi:hypothetical protein
LAVVSTAVSVLGWAVFALALARGARPGFRVLVAFAFAFAVGPVLAARSVAAVAVAPAFLRAARVPFPFSLFCPVFGVPSVGGSLGFALPAVGSVKVVVRVGGPSWALSGDRWRRAGVCSHILSV